MTPRFRYARAGAPPGWLLASNSAGGAWAAAAGWCEERLAGEWARDWDCERECGVAAWWPPAAGGRVSGVAAVAAVGAGEAGDSSTAPGCSCQCGSRRSGERTDMCRGVRHLDVVVGLGIVLVVGRARVGGAVDVFRVRHDETAEERWKTINWSRVSRISSSEVKN